MNWSDLSKLSRAKRYAIIAVLIAAFIALGVFSAMLKKVNEFEEPASKSLPQPTEAAAIANDAPSGTGILLTLQTKGGMCPPPGCGQRTDILLSGRYVVQNSAEETIAEGELETQAFDTLKTLVADTDFASLLSKPFSGICPTAHDGQLNEWTFHVPNRQGSFLLNSCKHDLSGDIPVIQQVKSLLASKSD